MADPLSISASVIAVITTFLQSSQALVDFVTTVRNAPDEVQAIAADTAAFNATVSSLQQSLRKPEVASIADNDESVKPTMKSIQLALSNSDGALKSLLGKLTHLSRSSSSGRRSLGTSDRFGVVYCVVDPII